VQNDVALAEQGAGEKLVERQKIGPVRLAEGNQVAHVSVKNKESVGARVVFF
jgi:hypothetical protein